MEVSHERSWFSVLQALDSDDGSPIRFLEGSGILARAWLNLVPSNRPNTLSDGEVRYALRSLFQSQFPEAVSGTGFCTRCKKADNPSHHLHCSKVNSDRGIRHTAARDAILGKCAEAKCGSIVKEEILGTNHRGVAVRADVSATINGVRSNFDVTYKKVHHSREFKVSNDEVNESIELDKARPPRPPPLFFWEDHSSETPHPQTVFIRKYRELAIQKSVMVDVGKAIRRKKNHYGQWPVVPLVFTYEGYLGKDVRELCDNLAIQFGDVHKESLGFMSYFRRDLLGRLCATRIKAHHGMWSEACSVALAI